MTPLSDQVRAMATALKEMLELREEHLLGNVHPKGELSIVASARAALASIDLDQIIAAVEGVWEPLAWMYAHEEFGQQLFHTRWDRRAGGTPDDFIGWTETPLYALRQQEQKP